MKTDISPEQRTTLPAQSKNLMARLIKTMSTTNCHFECCG